MENYIMIDAGDKLRDILGDSKKRKWIKKISKHDLSNRAKMGKVGIKELKKIIAENDCKIIKCSGDFNFDIIEVHYQYQQDYRESGKVLVVLIKQDIF